MSSSRSAAVRLFLALLLIVMACRPMREPGQESQREIATVRLDDVAARRLADSIEAAVSGEVAVAEGLQLRLWAPDHFMIDPHALATDHQGNVYVASSGRTRTQRAVNQRFRSRLAETLKFQTVDDLRTFLRAELAPELSDENHEWLPDLNQDSSHDWRDLTVQNERVYRIQDTSGDGRADLSEVIAEDFASEVTDIVGGLLVHGPNVYVGVAPGVWRLRDTTGDGVPDETETLSEGYGVRLGFFAHGMSGVTLGPDGRIYWSIGDVGLNVVDEEGKRWAYPNQGAILRANPDGSDFEVFAAGLRNVYEFAFDEHGNLIAADNDGDHPGEKERLVYLVEGSDSGWRTNWQYGKYTDPRNNDYKVWMDEGLHIPRFPGQAAHITPAIAPYVNGPAGMVYNPGTALGERWRDRFFIAESKGAASSVHAFSLDEDGASFTLAQDTVVVDGLLTTSMDFGSDGALYLSDLVVKIKPELGGRIWKLEDTDTTGSALRRETRSLLAGNVADRSVDDLLALLGHADMRVRLMAQFELVDRSAAKTLLEAVRRKEPQLARMHGLWGLGQLARADARLAGPLIEFLRDGDAEVRAQAAKVIGDAEYAPAGDALIPLLTDESPRVRFFSAQALGMIGHRPAVQPLIAMLGANDGHDAYLRHAGTLALARIGEAEPLVALADHPSRPVRVAAVVALRRMRDPGVARFLRDPDEYVVTEAARAINDDGGIAAALPALARLLEEERFTGEALLRRVINANLRLGTADGARRVSEYAARRTAPEAMRAEAIAGLGVWPAPSEFDRVDGMYRGAAQPRDPTVARTAVAPLIEPLFADGSPAAVKVALAEAAGRLELRAAEPVLLASLREDPSPEVRVASLTALQAMGTGQLEAAVRVALADPHESVRGAALGLLTNLDLPGTAAADLLASVVDRGSIEERQRALEALGRLQGPEAQRVLGSLLDRLIDGSLPAEIQLDLIEVVEASDVPELHAGLDRYRAARIADDPMSLFQVALHGGDALSGRQIVRRSDAAQCTRCHTVGEPGSNVGPDLSRIGSRLNRAQLLEALLDPSARIASGYGNPEGPSVMPSMADLLTSREIRDVIAYLVTLK